MTEASLSVASIRQSLRWAVAFAVSIVVQLLVLYLPRAPSTGTLPVDKVVHATVFGAVLYTGARLGLPARPLAAALVVHAVVSELIQHFLLSGRTGDPFDVVADLSGVLIVILFLRRRSQRFGPPRLSARAMHHG
jgi:VanZ family protein